MKDIHKLRVRCPKCGSDDVQVESYLAEDGTALEWGGFYCISCGHVVGKTAAGEDESEISKSLGGLEVHQLCAGAELAFCLGMKLEWKEHHGETCSTFSNH